MTSVLLLKIHMVASFAIVSNAVIHVTKLSADCCRLADKEASKHNHESVSGDIAPQPLTRRHSRTGSAGSLPRGASGNLSQGPSGSLMRNQSGGLVRGASTFLEENWQVVPKSPGPNIPKSPAPNGHDNAPAAADPDGEDEFVKKDT